MGKIRDWLGNDRVPIVVATVSVLLTLPAVGGGFQFDDLSMRIALLEHPDSLAGPGDVFSFIKGDPAVNREYMNLGVLPWWTADELRLAFLRPVTIATHRFDYALWPDSAALMHLHGLLWLGALVWLVAILYRRIVGPAWVAGLAAVLYALDDAHGYPAAWIANRNALIATTFGVIALICHDRWRRDGWRAGPLAAAACVALAIFSAEFGLAVVGYLAAYALVLEGGGRRVGGAGEDGNEPGANGRSENSAANWPQRIGSLVPYAPVLAVWLIVYRLGGYGTNASAFYVDPVRQTPEFLSSLLAHAPVLLLGQWALPYADAYNAVAGADALILWLRSIGMVALLAIILVPLVRRTPPARFWALGMVLSLIPISATAPSNRLLFFVGLGGMGLLAQFLGGLADEDSWRPRARPWRWVARGMAVFLVIVHLVLAPALLSFTAVLPRLLGEPVRAAMLSLPDEPGLSDQSLIIVNAPDHLIYVAIVWSMRVLEAETRPGGLHVLASQPVALEIERLDDRSLRIEFEGGLYRTILGSLFRGPDHPMEAGKVVELEGMTVEVVSVGPSGEPTAAIFRFVAPLEDPSYRWVRWDDGVYVPFSPPTVGATVRLPATRSPMEIQPDELIENYRKARSRTVSRE